MELNYSTAPYLKDKAGSNHILLLYTLDVDKYAIHRGFLASTREDEKAVIVSSDDRKAIKQGLRQVCEDPIIIKPEEVMESASSFSGGQRPRLIIDAGSFPDSGDLEIEERERYLDRIVREYSLNCLCTYKVSKVQNKMLRFLAASHSQLELTTGDLNIVSGDFMRGSTASIDLVKKTVKDNLEAIILTLLRAKAMCGSEIIGTVHLEFDVLLSPGAVYPLLNSLQGKGLLTSIKEGKEKIYAPTEGAPLKIKDLIIEQIQAQRLLNSYLQRKIDTGHMELRAEPS